MSERVWNPKPPTETVAFVDDWTDELGAMALRPTPSRASPAAMRRSARTVATARC
jgi:hypothetical protein